jgi:Phosphoesterase family
MEGSRMKWRIGRVTVTKIVELEVTGGGRFILTKARKTEWEENDHDNSEKRDYSCWPQPVSQPRLACSPPIRSAHKRATLLRTNISNTMNVARVWTKIKHIVFIVKENRTFDNYFGTFPGANGATSGMISTGEVIPLGHAPRAVQR